MKIAKTSDDDIRMLVVGVCVQITNKHCKSSSFVAGAIVGTQVEASTKKICRNVVRE